MDDSLKVSQTTQIKAQFDQAKTLLTSFNSLPINYTQVKTVLITALSSSNPQITWRLFANLFDLLEKRIVSSEFVCVKIIAGIETTNFSSCLPCLGYTIRLLDDPNFYVNVSEDVAVHILVYACMQLSPKVSGDNLELVLKMLEMSGSSLSSLAFKAVTDRGTKILTRTVDDTVTDFMDQTRIHLTQDVTDPKLYVYLDKTRDFDSDFLEIAVQSRSHKVLSSITQLEPKSIYHLANVCVDTYNSQALSQILELVNLNFECNSALIYCLINKILFGIEIWSCDVHIFKDMLNVCSRVLSVSFDQTQWDILTRFGYDRDIMKNSYLQFENDSISTSLRDLCLKHDPKWLSESADTILTKLKTFQVDEKHKSTIRSTVLSRPPIIRSNFDTPDCVLYTDETGTNFAFTSTSIDSLMTTKTNPYTGLELSQNFLDRLPVFRALNRRLALLKYQFNHETSPRELISSYQSVYCTKSVVQTAKLFGCEDLIVKMSCTAVFKILKLINLEPERLFPNLGLGVWALGKVEGGSDECVDEWQTTSSPDPISKHALNTICQLIANQISGDLRLAKIFYSRVCDTN